MLPAAAAEDAALVAALSDLVNHAYDAAEQGLWHDGIARTTPGETGWFGALAVSGSDGGRGVGSALVALAERRARSGGATTMQMELLGPEATHAHTDRLAAWYRRLGYREIERRDLADVDPAAVPFLAVPLAVAVMEKRLA
jgi:GNAT superfamily N-acetyltransferase